jgi:hypothetical protein
LKKKPKPNRNRVKPTGFDSVRFGFFREKTGSNRFGSVFPVLARFFPVFSVWLGFGSVFLVWLSFFPGFLSVRFGFLVIKPKPNQTGWFFQKFNQFNRFFFSVRFFRFFFGFLGLIGFLIFLLTPTSNP